MNVVGREAWGAVPPKGRDALAPTDARGIAIHYTGMNSDEHVEHANCPGRVRVVQRYHMKEKGWLDIAYSHVVCKHGYVFVGRGYGIRTAANGTKRANNHYFAICFLGDDTPGRDDLTRAGRRALGELIRDYRRRYPRALHVRPHSAFVATDCPGRELGAYIDRRGWI
ncbi:MAG: N-acetylmuramoyl-L-alanine amidase [Gaiellaceae bacterium]